MKIAAVTMVFNEAAMLPLWLRHYARQVTPGGCYVVDHGSDDGSTVGIAGDVSVVRIPRSQYNEETRAGFISDFCSSLLKWYDWVLYSDVDEMLVVDPANGQSLIQYCSTDRPDVVTAFGVNVLHRLHHETALDPKYPILGQRRWMFALSSMAKPALTRVPIQWSPGFHSSDSPTTFDGLINFHLAYVDLKMTIARQVKRRLAKMDTPSHHHHMADDDLFHMMENWSNMATIEDVTLKSDCARTSALVAEILNSRKGRENETFKINTDIWMDQLWNVPGRFYGLV